MIIAILGSGIPINLYLLRILERAYRHPEVLDFSSINSAMTLEWGASKPKALDAAGVLKQ